MRAHTGSRDQTSKSPLERVVQLIVTLDAILSFRQLLLFCASDGVMYMYATVDNVKHIQAMAAAENITR